MNDSFRAMIDAKLDEFRQWRQAHPVSGCRWVHYTGVEITGADDVPLEEVEQRLENAVCEAFKIGWAEHQRKLYVRVWEGDAEPAWDKVFAEASLVDVSACERTSAMSDLNHPKVRAFSREVGTRLGLEPSFIDFVLAKPRPAVFDYWCDDANNGWTCFVPDSIDIAFPLWSTNADQTLLLVSESGIAYGEGHHDSPELWTIAATAQSLLAHLLNQLFESEATDDEMVSAAKFCGFRYLDALLEFEAARQHTALDWDATWSRFSAEIDAAEARLAVQVSIN